MIDPKSLRIGNTPLDDLSDAIGKSGVKITFGIQPHHIEKIEARRAKINSIKLNDPELEKYKSDIVYSHSFWEIMGKECGWDGLSLALAYFEHKVDSGLTPTEPETKEHTLNFKLPPQQRCNVCNSPVIGSNGIINGDYKEDPTE